MFVIPGRGLRGGVFIHVLGAETLKRGVPVIARLAADAAGRAWLRAAGRSSRRACAAQVATLAVALIVTLGVPMVTESYQWFVDVTPGPVPADLRRHWR